MAINNDILQELKEMNSPLAELPERMPFNLPEGYFEQLPDVVNEAKERELSKAMPHTTPVGYFDRLPQQVIAAAISKPTQQRKTVQFAPIRWMAAAILVITITIGGYNFLQPNTPSFEEQLSNIPETDLLAYVQYNIDEFGPEVLEANITDVSISTDKIEESNLQEYIENEVW